MLVLIHSFCCGSTLWRNCLCGFQLANRTAFLYPCLPRKKLFSKPRLPETAPKGKKWDMDHQRSERRLVHFSHFCSLAPCPGCVCWSLLKEGSSPGKISFCWPAYTPWEWSTSRSQNKILKANVTITVRVVGCSFMRWYARDTVVGLCVLHQRYCAAFILDQTGLRFVPL